MEETEAEQLAKAGTAIVVTVRSSLVRIRFGIGMYWPPLLKRRAAFLESRGPSTVTFTTFGTMTTCACGCVKMVMLRLKFLPRPLLPTKRKSWKCAYWPLNSAVLFLTSAQKFSSLPADKHTRVPSAIGQSASTTNGVGNALFDRQWLGNVEQNTSGWAVFWRWQRPAR